MAFILGVVLVPALLYSFWQAVDAYRERHAQQSAIITSALRVIASYESEFFDKTRTLLNRLAREPAIRNAALRNAEQPACNDRLVEARSQTWDYNNFVVLNATGEGVCSSSNSLLGSLPDRTYLARLRAGEDFVVTNVVERLTTTGRTIVAVVALREEGTRTFAGALAVGINLQTFQTAVNRLDLPAGGVAYLVDGRGRILIEPPAIARDAADAAAYQSLFRQLLAMPGTEITARGPDGIQRDYFLANLAGEDVHVVVGVPSLRPFAWLQRDLVIGIFAPTLMLALAVVAIWIASDYLVNRHVRTLAAAARAYSLGELDLQLDFSAAPEEFQELAQTLARMAKRIQRREDELRASLAQKELLLREVHHRVKNNLQIVTSLLNLRAQRLHSPVARDAVRQAQMRISALALVHRNLYQTEEIQVIELQEFVTELCGLIEEIHDTGEASVQLSVSAEPMQLLTDQATPLALLLTEAVSNAFKHAFPEGKSGTIEVQLRREGDRARLIVSDDGVGLPGGDEAAGGMGVTLMRMLAKQLGGSLTLVEGAGTRLEVEFPLTRHKSPIKGAGATPAGAAAA